MNSHIISFLGKTQGSILYYITISVHSLLISCSWNQLQLRRCHLEGVEFSHISVQRLCTSYLRQKVSCRPDKFLSFLTIDFLQDSLLRRANKCVSALGIKKTPCLFPLFLWWLGWLVRNAAIQMMATFLVDMSGTIEGPQDAPPRCCFLHQLWQCQKLSIDR